ncbi:hypothetical protein SUGI_0544700 [Cryptomeria japonica]|nr:hypothetical protein SUGI_0544700 [Cryptomeria japonica]
MHKRICSIKASNLSWIQLTCSCPSSIPSAINLRIKNIESPASQSRWKCLEKVIKTKCKRAPAQSINSRLIRAEVAEKIVD